MKKKVELTEEQIQACEDGFSQAESNDYVSTYSSRKEIEDNIYEILEFGCDDVDELFLTDEEINAAIDYINDELCD